MDELTLARVLHVVGVVFWIGGVAMVTTVILPTVRRFKEPEERVVFFEHVEHRFAWQARLTTLITGISGFFLMHHLDAWERYAHASFWWIHAMTVIWVIFTVMLFILEPLVLRHWFSRRARQDPELIFNRVQRLHWVLLVLSLLTIVGAVAGSHGWFFV